MAVLLEWREVGGAIVISLAGTLTVADGNILRQTARRLLQAGHRRFILNLGELDKIDSSGVGQLVATFTAVRTSGAELKLVNPTPGIRNTFRITMLDTIFAILPSEAEALKAFGS